MLENFAVGNQLDCRYSSGPVVADRPPVRRKQGRDGGKKMTHCVLMAGAILQPPLV